MTLIRLNMRASRRDVRCEPRGMCGWRERILAAMPYRDWATDLSEIEAPRPREGEIIVEPPANPGLDCTTESVRKELPERGDDEGVDVRALLTRWATDPSVNPAKWRVMIAAR